MKKSKLINLFYAAAVMLVVGMTVVPSYASDHEYDFEFDFEYGNRVSTSSEMKHNDGPIVMTCTGSSGTSGVGYSAKAYSRKGMSTGEMQFDAGVTRYFYDVAYFSGDVVYIQGALNSYDVDSFWGVWNPD